MTLTTAPADQDTEADLCGLAMLQPALTDLPLDGTHFSEPRLGAIWDAIRTLHARGIQPDPTGVVEAAKPARVDHFTVVDLFGRQGIPGNAPIYVERILERHRRDQIDKAITRAQQALTTDLPVTQVAANLQDALQAVPVTREARATTWRRVELNATLTGLLSGTLQRPAPTVGQVRGGLALFYRGRVNGVAGESGAGKTWTALHVAHQLLDAGGSVLYIDHEDDEFGILSRMLDLGSDPDALRDRFAYLNPTERPTADDLTNLAALVDELRPALVVLDSTGEGLALEGANPNADEEVVMWFVRIPRRLASVDYDGQPGPAVVVLDHVTKADDGGLWPIGSQRKRAAINGAQYMQRVIRPFSKDTAGAAVLICAKDRHGNYRMGQRVADLNVTPGPSIALDAVPTATTTNPFRPTALMQRVSEALERAPEPLSFNDVVKAARAKREHIITALGVLVAEGHVTVTTGTRNTKFHTLVKPYVQADDPRSDVRSDREPVEPLTMLPGTVTDSRSIDREPGNQSHTGSRNQWGTSGNRSETARNVCLVCGGSLSFDDGTSTHPTCTPDTTGATR